MKIIALEEHYGLPVIYKAAEKANDGVTLAYDVLKKLGKFNESKTGFPAGIYDLNEGRIAAMDDAGIDVSIPLVPYAERGGPRAIAGDGAD